MDAEARQAELRRRLHALGFDEVRFARVDGPAPGAGALRAWLDAGLQADMAWMERTAEKRAQPSLVLPGARSVILLGVNYGREERGKSPRAALPAWARYSLYSDYHDTLQAGLASAGQAIEEIFGAGGTDYRYYVDTGPVLERSWAERAGLGFIGKNTMLISRRFGNWLFLASILTKLELAPDPPVRKKIESGKTRIGLLCGKCTRCLDACPTQALPRPGVLDARRCISYQTIENRGIIPRELRPGIGARIYGCDTCLEVCPWNRFARSARGLLLAARGEIAALPLREILELTPARFAEIFRGTAIKRVKLAGLLRNACVVAGNSGDRSLLELLAKLAAHALPVVRAHAVWAVFRLAGAEAGTILAGARKAEADAVVLAEYAAG
ncbi:MAG TPA: tRNA epoxyqueuosine(34) reductase QueG [Opitutaceae bacterium]|jgi:epoxyqueuosine reductase|nr:tRNA epoxyqueuosine(34) reductase QueG [Opitutaceae bacterium]